MGGVTMGGATGWDVVGPVPVVALFAAAVLAWGLLLVRRGRRPRLTGLYRRVGVVASVVVAAVLTTAATADAVNASFAYAPDLGDVAGLANGSGDWNLVPTLALADPAAAPPGTAGVVPLRVPDDGTGVGSAGSLVWLPPQYVASPTARFPVVYLLHGSPGVPADWLRGGRLAVTASELARRGQPAIVVLPRMSRGWLDDPECVDGAQEQVETHFWRDVVPLVDRTFRTVPTRDARVLAGMSAGGFCALNLGLKHRDRVATIVDLSGLTMPTRSGGMRALYGSGDIAARARQDTPARYAPRLPADPPTRVWLDTGADDGQVRSGLSALAPVLRSRGLQVELHVRPGAHTFHVWRPALREALQWALPATRGATR